MLGWIFKKPFAHFPTGAPAATPAATPEASPTKPAKAAKPGKRSAPASAQPPSPTAAAPAATRPLEAVDWAQRLQAAGGDDAALAALASSAAPLDVRRAAVQAITGEAALKLAERNTRGQDRRVHQLAKQRLADQQARRETDARAAALMASARALLHEPQIAVNHLVELDRGWKALDAAHLSDAVRAEFEPLLQQLTTLTRERGDMAQRAKRWQSQAREALARLTAVADDAAAGLQGRAEVAAARAAALVAQAAAPVPDPGLQPDAATQALADALADAAQAAQALDERLDLLDAWLAVPAESGQLPGPAAATGPMPQPAADTAPETAADATPETAPEAAPDAAAPPVADLAPTAADVPAAQAAAEPAAVAPTGKAVLSDLAERWQALPPLPRAAREQALQQRWAAAQQAREAAHQGRRAQQRERQRDAQRAQQVDRKLSLAGALEQAEAALDSGHLADTHAQLLHIDELLHGGAPVATLRTRIDNLQARYAQLKGWQHWAGGRARDDLTQQAEALAAAAGSTEQRTVRLSIQQQAEVIEDMRARWKELDRLGGATSRALWQRFDAALKQAYAPVAAHLDAQRAQREHNLQARRQLIHALAEVPLPGSETALPAEPLAPGHEPASDEAAARAANDPPPLPPGAWRAVAEALDHFHTEWRKLGPLQHTVPRKAQDPLTRELDAATARLQQPLQQARQQAQHDREQLLAQARACAEQARAGTAGRESLQQARELQAAWQQQARALPLQRATENALWADFKAAIDAIYGARDAAVQAREAEFKAHADERRTLIEKLEALPAELSDAELRRALREADEQWQRAGPAPHHEAAALQARWLTARNALRDSLAQGSQRAWLRVCDALAAKRALCDEAAALGATELAARWQALPALPPPWEQALSQRAGLPSSEGAGAAARVADAAATVVDGWLLQLEAAWDQPSPAAHQDARRQLKLQAMKAAMESRRTAATPALTADQLWAGLLGQPQLTPEQRQRLDALQTALRQRGHTG